MAWNWFFRHIILGREGRDPVQICSVLQRRGERRATINEELCGVFGVRDDETRSEDLPRLYTYLKKIA